MSITLFAPTAKTYPPYGLQPLNEMAHRDRHSSRVSIFSPRPTNLPTSQQTLKPKATSNADQNVADQGQVVTVLHYDSEERKFYKISPVSSTPDGDISDAPDFIEKPKVSLQTARSMAPPIISAFGQRSAITHENFRMVRRIRTGGEGSCNVVRHKQSRQLFCLKTVIRPDTEKKVPWEAHVLKTLLHDTHHPNIIKLDFWIYNDSMRPRFVEYFTEFFPLGDLIEFVDRLYSHGLQVPEIFIWHAYLQLLSAIEFLHAGFHTSPNFIPPNSPKRQSLVYPASRRLGIVHRDVKPENILVRRPRNGNSMPDVILTDFGHASVTEFTYDPCGTAAWSAPEMPRSSQKTDVWSVGAVAHYLIHEAPPISRLPDLYEPTRDNIHRWEMMAEAREPRLHGGPLGYSRDLVWAMSQALKMDEAKRLYAKDLRPMIQEEYTFLRRTGSLQEPVMPDWDLLERCR